MEEETYDRRLITVGGALERYKRRSVGNVLPDGCNHFSFEITPIAAPDVPPEVLQPASGRIVQLPVRDGVYFMVNRRGQRPVGLGKQVEKGEGRRDIGMWVYRDVPLQKVLMTSGGR